VILRQVLAGLMQSAPARVEALPGGHNKLVRGRHGLFLANANDIYVGRSLIHYGEFSELEWRLLSRLCAPAGIIAEVGANVGAFTVALAKAVGERGEIIAVEPQPEIHRMLCATIALNGLANVAPLQMGCGERAETLRIPDYDHGHEANFAGMSLRGHAEATATVPVEVRRLDDLLRPRARLDLLKIDVEGMEAEVIRGGTEAIGAFRPVLYVENDRVEMSPELIELIGKLGYRMWWHMPPLFNPDNYFGNRSNLLGPAVSFNMLCLHGSQAAGAADGLAEVTDPSRHPRTGHI
jgi:FkbM family methyltransferase